METFELGQKVQCSAIEHMNYRGTIIGFLGTGRTVKVKVRFENGEEVAFLPKYLWMDQKDAENVGDVVSEYDSEDSTDSDVESIDGDTMDSNMGQIGDVANDVGLIAPRYGANLCI